MDGFPAITEVMSAVKMGSVVRFTMRLPSAADSHRVSEDDEESLALARRLQQEEHDFQQARAALIMERREEADRRAAQQLADEHEASLALARQLQADQHDASLALARQLQAEDEESGRRVDVPGAAFPPSGYPLPHVYQAADGRSSAVDYSPSALRSTLGRQRSAA